MALLPDRCRLAPTRSTRLHRHRPLLVRPALDGSGLAMAGDHAHALVNPCRDVVRGAALQEGDAVAAAGRQDAVSRGLHFPRKRFAGYRAVTERKTEIAR